MFGWDIALIIITLPITIVTMVSYYADAVGTNRLGSPPLSCSVVDMRGMNYGRTCIKPCVRHGEHNGAAMKTWSQGLYVLLCVSLSAGTIADTECVNETLEDRRARMKTE